MIVQRPPFLINVRLSPVRIIVQRTTDQLLYVCLQYEDQATATIIATRHNHYKFDSSMNDCATATVASTTV